MEGHLKNLATFDILTILWTIGDDDDDDDDYDDERLMFVDNPRIWDPEQNPFEMGARFQGFG